MASVFLSISELQLGLSLTILITLNHTNISNPPAIDDYRETLKYTESPVPVRFQLWKITRRGVPLLLGPHLLSPETFPKSET